MIERFITKIGSYIKCFMLKIKYGKKINLKYTKKMALSVKILCHDNAKIEIGDNFCSRERGTILSTGDGFVEIGNDFFMNYNSTIVSMCHIKIGENVWFGPNVFIYDHDHKFDENGKKEGYKLGEVIIGNNVWIGAGAIILRGTKIGDNSIIGAGCVVKGEIPNNSLVTQERELKITKLEKR